LADIRESIRELEYYRRTVFVAQPGPDIDAAKAIAATVAAQHPIG
jgi:oligoribonuclease